MDLKINSNKKIIFSLLYLSLLLGFYFNENTSGGAYPDFEMRLGLIEKFKNDFVFTFLNYNDYNDRHSPILIMFISTLSILGLELDFIRFIHLNLLILLVLISFKCLKIKYPSGDKDIIFLISCVFFLSPSLRSIAIWPDSRILGLIIFLSSIIFFLKFKDTKQFKDCIYSNILLIISSYISPNFSIFFLYFLYFYIQYLNFSKKLIIIILINICLSIPMIYYLFVLDVNFLTTTAVANINILNSLNISNKIFIISTLLFFYTLPFIPGYLTFCTFKKNLKLNHLFSVIILFLILINFFNYSINYTGGGIFFKLSYLLFNNSLFFFFVFFISIIFILNIFKLNINNILLFIVLVLSNPQLTIYHKYFDPMLILLIFLLFDLNFKKEKLISKKFLSNIYFFYTFLLLANFGRYFF